MAEEDPYPIFTSYDQIDETTKQYILGVSDSENISDVSLEDINSFFQGLHQYYSES
jgi:hypothetical protein